MQEREGRLSEELSQAQGNLELLRRLHQASQNQLFSMQSRSEEAAAGLQSELELATDEMERSQQRMATLEQEKASLLARLQQQQQQQAGGDGDGEAGAVASGAAGGGGRFAEDSLRQELYAQVGVGDWKTCMAPCSVLGLSFSPALWHVYPARPKHLRIRDTFDQLVTCLINVVCAHHRGLVCAYCCSGSWPLGCSQRSHLCGNSWSQVRAVGPGCACDSPRCRCKEMFPACCCSWLPGAQTATRG